MRLNSNSLFRNFFLLMALLSSLLLTACGGGGGGGGGDGLREALIGTWYLNFEDGKPVVPNSKGEVDTLILKSDGTCSMTEYGLTDYNHPNYWEVQESEGTDKGAWRYADGRLYIKIDGEEFSSAVSLDNGALKMTGTYEDSSETWISVFKKTKYGDKEDSGGGSSQPVTPTNPTTLTKNDLVGTWYLNYEDGKPVHTNSKGEVSSMVLNSNGTCTMKDYDLTTRNHSDYWEPEGTVYNDSGTWSYSNGKLTTVIDGYTMSVSVTFNNGALTLNGTEPEPWTSVYKKTKYSL